MSLLSTPATASHHLGVCRSRTLLFRSYRDSVPKHGQSSALAGLNDITSTELPPPWKDTSDEVEGTLAALLPRIALLDRLHAKHILPGFADRTEEERDIERETVEITKSFRRCSKLIAGLAGRTQRLARSGQGSAHEIAMARNMQTLLATKVQDASGTFRRKQSNYMQRLRGHEERHKDLTAQSTSSPIFKATHASQSGGGGSKAYLFDSETAVREDMELSRQQLAMSKSHEIQTQLLLDEESAPLQSAELNIAQRDREIDQIARSIADLAELFQDLSALVIDQGTMLDRIDFNIEHMGQDMHEAVRELNTATMYQKRSSRGQCMLFIILLILLCIAVIIVKPFWRLLFR